MRKHVLIALLAMSSLPATLHAEEQVCDRSETKATPSPDGQWVANVQEEVCTTATGAAAGITVVIASTKDPARTKRVFIMPVPASRDDWPRIRWDGSNAMQVRVPNLSGATPPDPEFAGIRISLAYCGDNPQDRASAAATRRRSSNGKRKSVPGPSAASRMQTLPARGRRVPKSPSSHPAAAATERPRNT